MSEPAPSRALKGRGILDDPLVGELLAARLVGVLSTLEPDGSVHSVALWFASRGGAIVFATGSRSRKVRNLERDPRATVVLHDSRPGFEVCGASIRGAVEIFRGAVAQPFVTLVHDRYVTAEGQSLPAPASFLASDDVALVLWPETAVTWDERGGDAAEELRRTGAARPLEPTAPRPT
ncbi:MAG: pyridoxamine 5'-phosphate oxidase family protein [Gaiellales bacterium]